METDSSGTDSVRRRSGIRRSSSLDDIAPEVGPAHITFPPNSIQVDPQTEVFRLKHDAGPFSAPLKEQDVNTITHDAVVPEKKAYTKGKSRHHKFLVNVSSKLGLHRRVQTSDSVSTIRASEHDRRSPCDSDSDSQSNKSYPIGFNTDESRDVEAIREGRPQSNPSSPGRDHLALKSPGLSDKTVSFSKVEDILTAAVGPFIPLSMKTVGQCLLSNATPQRFLDHIISDDSRSFWAEFHKNRGDKDFTCSPWEREDLFNCSRRSLSFRHPINYVIGPKSVLCHQIQRYKVHPDGHLVIYAEQMMPDLPFGDYFSVHIRWDIKPLDDGASSVSVAVEVPFSKRTMLKGRIEQGAIDESQETYSLWLDQAKAALESNVCICMKGHDIYGPTLAACLAEIIRKENLQPILKTEVSALVTVLQASGFLEAANLQGEAGSQRGLGSPDLKGWSPLAATVFLFRRLCTLLFGCFLGIYPRGLCQQSTNLLQEGSSNIAGQEGGRTGPFFFWPVVGWISLFLPVILLNLLVLKVLVVLASQEGFKVAPLDMTMVLQFLLRNPA